MSKQEGYRQMTVKEFLQTELFKEHLENVLNNLLHGYNELTISVYQKSKELKKAPLINLIQEGLLDDTSRFIKEYYSILGRISTRSHGERITIKEIGDGAIHSAIRSLETKK